MAKKSLGADFSSILDDISLAYDDEMSGVFHSELDSIKEIDIDEITPNPYQPRKNFNEDSINELAISIKNHGLLQPIVVIDADELCEKAKENGEVLEKTTKYFLIAGERRLRAFKTLKETKIRAIIANIDSGKTRELALLENIQREDLNPIELALAYKELMRVRNITQEELAQSIQKSRANIANTLRLLTLSEDTQKLIIEGKLSAGHAKVIAGQKEDEKILVNTVIGQKLNVRDCEKLANKLKGKSLNHLLDEQLLNKLKEFEIDFKLQNGKLILNLSQEKTKNFIEKAIKNL
ncbi:chromosome partitioning protein [Campylobacter sp. RM5004]|uniref:ParB/RepB/Spo0J family partition protein n=1 Tax=Campylobacter sp. RM5004 TaxID=1660078 RepID=UPI001EFB377E|nr:ParB/RepB/Spo0J family partition protein [Campylobacter sp. RM5004]ULO01033.1 chromosome partitioning protein [Campylobacter sp. RM5004]